MTDWYTDTSTHQFTAKGLLGSSTGWHTSSCIKWIPMSQMYSLVIVKNTDCLRMRGTINLMDLLDMRGSSEKHFSHTLFHSRLLATLFQGRQQLLMGLHNIANVTYQLTVFFFCQTEPAHANECVIIIISISLHLKSLLRNIQRSWIYIPANVIYTESIGYKCRTKWVKVCKQVY